MKTACQWLLLLALACLLPTTQLFAQGAPGKSPEFDHTTVHVRDLQKSVDFYEKVFGFERIQQPFKDTNHIWLRVGAHQQLHIVGGGAGNPGTDVEIHFAFRVPSTTDFTAHLDQLQVKYQSFDGKGKVTVRPDGVYQIYFQDPDGFWIEVNDNKF